MLTKLVLLSVGVLLPATASAGVVANGSAADAGCDPCGTGGVGVLPMLVFGYDHDEYGASSVQAHAKADWATNVPPEDPENGPCVYTVLPFGVNPTITLQTTAEAWVRCSLTAGHSAEFLLADTAWQTCSLADWGIDYVDDNDGCTGAVDGDEWLEVYAEYAGAKTLEVTDVGEGHNLHPYPLAEANICNYTLGLLGIHATVGPLSDDATRLFSVELGTNDDDDEGGELPGL